MRYQRETLAVILKGAQSDPTAVNTLKQMIKDGDLELQRTYTDRTWRGNGNKAVRRLGDDPSENLRCGCVVCVEYGGDCARVMYQEGRTAEHIARRGVKTRCA